MSGARRDGDARGLAGRLLQVALAVLHAPAYQADHRSALSADWAHLPAPKDIALFHRLAEVGELVARLLDADADTRDQVFAATGDERAAQLAQLRTADGGPIRPEDLKVTVNCWGGPRAAGFPRRFTSEEGALPAWGEHTGDLYIAEGVFFANVPQAVWNYELGGYPVLKKWLAYRRADRRDERRWFRSIVRTYESFA
jgi:Type ISP C-terminal specificity domain